MNDLIRKIISPFNSLRWKSIYYFFGTFRFPFPKYSRDPRKDLGVYVSFSELFQKQPNSLDIIKKEFSQFFVRDIIQWLCKVNYYLRDKYVSSLPEEYKLARDFLSLTDSIDFSHLKGSRKFFSRQQILSNLRLALLYSKDNIHKKMVEHNKELAFKMVYRVTDFMELRKIRNRRTTRAVVMRTLLFGRNYTFVMAMGRYNYIFRTLGEKFLYTPGKLKGWSLNKIFKEVTRVPFEFYLAIGFAIWGFYEKRNFAKRFSKPNEFLFSKNWFKKTNVFTRRNYGKVLKIASSTFPEMRSELLKTTVPSGEFFSFQHFFRKPLVRDHNSYYLLDLGYLEQRFTEGAWWHIFDSTLDTKQNLRAYWGKLFEHYILDLVQSVIKPKLVLSEIKGDFSGQVDILINLGDTLIAIEITSKRLRLVDWVSGDPDLIEKGIKEILLDSDEKGTGKAQQLFNLWEKIRKRDIKLDGVDLEKIKRFIPIIVFEESLPVHDGVWQVYKKLLRQGGIPTKFTNLLHLWSVEDLELVLGDHEQGNDLVGIIDEIIKAGYQFSSIRNYYIFQRKIWKAPKMVKRSSDAISRLFAKILFKKKKV